MAILLTPFLCRDLEDTPKKEQSAFTNGELILGYDACEVCGGLKTYGECKPVDPAAPTRSAQRDITFAIAPPAQALGDCMEKDEKTGNYVAIGTSPFKGLGPPGALSADKSYVHTTRGTTRGRGGGSLVAIGHCASSNTTTFSNSSVGGSASSLSILLPTGARAEATSSSSCSTIPRTEYLSN